MKTQLVTNLHDNYPVIRVELTRRNLEVLLAKLDDPNSTRTLYKGDCEVAAFITAVENDVHYGDRDPGPMLVNGELV
jgi:hypothetical protein